MSSELIKEYLVGLGIKDDFSAKLKDTLTKSAEEVKVFAKGFVVAGGAVASLLVTANTGIAKFVINLVKSDEEITEYAKSIGKTKDEAFKLKSTLDAMGKSMEEIEGDSELSKVFQQLQKDAEKIKPPDLSEGLKQVKEIQMEFTRLKQSGTYAVQWVGHYLFKYLQQPMQKIKEIFGGLNDTVIKNLPKWSEKIASVMASFVRIGLAVIRGAATIFNAIKRIFDMIPKELKIVGAALAALALFIRAGPIGKLITIISLALLLLEDFYTYLDGGDALLGGLWQTLIDIWNVLKDSGALEKLKENFQKALECVKNKLIEAKDYVVELFNKFKDSGSIEMLMELLKNLKDLFLELIEPVKNLGKELFDCLGGRGKDFFEWLVTTALPNAISLLVEIVEVIKNFVGKLNDMGVTEEIIKGIGLAFLGWKIKKGVESSIDGITNSIEEAKKKVDAFDKALSSVKEPNKLFESITKLKKSTIKAFKGASGAIKGIGSAVFKSIGSAIGFLTSPMGIALVAIAALIAITVLVIKNWDRVKEFFIKLWDKVKETFSGVGTWFKDKFQQAKDKIIELFSNIGDWFKDKFQQAKDKILEVFSNIGDWFKEKFQQAKDKILEVFSNIGDWFKGKFEDIKNGAKSIPGFLNDKFKQAREKTQNAFGPTVSWFKDKWSNIKDTFSESDSYFGRVFTASMQAIEVAFGATVDYFKMIWENIKLIFSAVTYVLSGDFQGAYNAIVQIWNNIVGFFSKLIENIKITFAPIVEWFKEKKSAIVEKFSNLPHDLRDKFLDAVNKIKEVFSPLVEWFKEKIDAIKGFFTGIGDKVKSVFDDVPNTPSRGGVSGRTGVPSGGGHADGGIFDKEHTARFAEGNKAEAVIPLTKPTRAKELISKSMDFLGMDNPDKLSKKVENLARFAENASNMLGKLSAGINQNTNYTNTTNSTITNNYKIEMPNSYTIHDSSGRPEATAQAVDRTTQMRIRNLQGVLN